MSSEDERNADDTGIKWGDVWFVFIAVAIIVIVRTLGFLISKVVIHFSFHHFLNGAA